MTAKEILDWIVANNAVLGVSEQAELMAKQFQLTTKGTTAKLYVSQRCLEKSRGPVFEAVLTEMIDELEC